MKALKRKEKALKVRDCNRGIAEAVVYKEKDSYKGKNKGKNEDSTISSYLKDISQYTLLSFEEEKELSRQVQETGDDEALEKLIQGNLRLVIKIASYFAKRGYNLNDLIQDGNIGLMRAAQKFDYSKNVRFATYAGPWIKQTIIRSLQKTSIIKIPYRKEDVLKKAKKSSLELSHLYNREPTIEELSKRTELPKSELKKALDYKISVVSLETSIDEAEQFTLEDTIESKQQNPIESLLGKDLSKEMKKALETLYPQEREVIICRFGLDNKEEQTLKNIAVKLGISTENVRRIAYKSLQKLKVNHEYLARYINN